MNLEILKRGKEIVENTLPRLYKNRDQIQTCISELEQQIDNDDYKGNGTAFRLSFTYKDKIGSETFINKNNYPLNDDRASLVLLEKYKFCKRMLKIVNSEITDLENEFEKL